MTVQITYKPNPLVAGATCAGAGFNASIVNGDPASGAAFLSAPTLVNLGNRQADATGTPLTFTWDGVPGVAMTGSQIVARAVAGNTEKFSNIVPLCTGALSGKPGEAVAYKCTATEATQCVGKTCDTCKNVVDGWLPLVPCGRSDQCGTPCQECKFCDLFKLVQNIILFSVFEVVPPIAVFFIALGGLLILLSAGNEQRRTQGKAVLKTTLIGIVIIFTSWIIINTVIKTFATNLAGGSGGSWYTFSCGTPPAAGGVPSVCGDGVCEAGSEDCTLCAADCGSCSGAGGPPPSPTCDTVANCAGRQCGPDGCGGSCPPGCATGQPCTVNGLCQCLPQCTGKTCGPDGCGGFCPPGCGANQTCNASGQCACAPESDSAFCARVGKACGQATGTDNCGSSRTVSSCGACTAPSTCNASGQCACVPESNSAFCTRTGHACGATTGTDNCGTSRTVASCGTCSAPNTCNASGQCACAAETDAAFCARVGKACGTASGTDNCGSSRTVSSCGTCTVPNTCNASGQCVCVPESDSAFCTQAGKTCGTASGTDNCGSSRTVSSCGACAAPNACDASGQCVCAPQCSGKTCGSDGCGGTCGMCASPSVCDASGQCVPPPPPTCNFNGICEPSLGDQCSTCSDCVGDGSCTNAVSVCARYEFVGGKPGPLYTQCLNNAYSWLIAFLDFLSVKYADPTKNIQDLGPTSSIGDGICNQHYTSGGCGGFPVESCSSDPADCGPCPTIANISDANIKTGVCNPAACSQNVCSAQCPVTGFYDANSACQYNCNSAHYGGSGCGTIESDAVDFVVPNSATCNSLAAWSNTICAPGFNFISYNLDTPGTLHVSVDSKSACPASPDWKIPANPCP